MSEFYFLDSNCVLLRISNHTLRNLHKYAHLYKKSHQDRVTENYVSSELPELIGMCDRIYIMNEGRFIGELNKEEATQERIMQIIVDDKGGYYHG